MQNILHFFMDGPGLWYILCPFKVSLVCACRRPPRAKCTADRWWWRPRRDSEELGLFCTSRMLSALCPLFRACACYTLSQPTRERASSRTRSGRQKTTKCERLRAFFQPILLLQLLQRCTVGSRIVYTAVGAWRQCCSVPSSLLAYCFVCRIAKIYPL